MNWKAFAIKASLEKNDISVTDRLVRTLLGLDNDIEDGGPGSGFFGHAGRPGKKGGSAPRGQGGSEEIAKGKATALVRPITSYSSFAKHEQFKGISSGAKAAPDYKSFVRSMSKEQSDALMEQRAACGTNESMEEYSARIYNMLHKGKEAPVSQENRPVEGRDITESYEYQGEKVAEGANTTATKNIDTKIEDVLHQQGFDGVPKIVTREEFDKITNEHPEMPILLRTYTANGEEQLKSYDDDLERGHFYVDGGEGGSAYGQGMYTTGAYKKKIVSMNDTEDLATAGAIDTGDGKAYVMEDGETYIDSMREFDNLGNGDVVLCMEQDDNYNTTKAVMLKKEERKGIFGLKSYRMIDMSTGLPYEGKLRNFNSIRKASDIVDRESADRILEEKRQETLKGAMEDVRFYQKSNSLRLGEKKEPIVPEGMESAKSFSGGVYYYFDPKSEARGLRNNPPEAESLILLHDPDPESPYNNTVWIVNPYGHLQSPDGRKAIFKNDFSRHMKWVPVQGECEIEEKKPVSTTRMMTLDPGSRIITEKELNEEIEKQKGKIIGGEVRKEVRKLCEERGIENKNIQDFVCYSYLGEEGKDKAEEIYRNMSEKERKMYIDLALKGAVFFDNGDIEKITERAKKKFEKEDHGVLAAMLGYDAINVEGRGNSGSYTIVLNRTKVVLCDEPAE